ncbi:helix-turn-helix domain-containing protein [Streptomyces sp. enrichment culture]|uniref:helix-turn-helix domain-containing protein n=1 Tax=Streptomyces sp. enrichment culture TaxID=1795815 RepID=UPI003F55A57A
MRALPAPEPRPEGVRASARPQYEWRLRELMAVRKNWYTTTKLTEALHEYGFDFDRSHIYRLVSGDKPPKMPVDLLLALCKILGCRFEELVVEAAPAQGDVSQLPDQAGPRALLPESPMLDSGFFDAEA